MIEVVRGSTQTTIAMLVWVPIVLMLFATLTPRRAVLAAFIIAWLFLPQASYRITLLPGLTKMNITALSVLLGIILFDTNSLTRFKPTWYDVPIFIVIFSPVITSISVGLGPYDGFSWARQQFISIGLPYLFGRLYFMSPQGLKDLTIGLFIGGLLYTPFVLWEHRVSPQLHLQIYGYRQHSFAQQVRPGGGYRPMVFMQHGLAVGMWMTITALSAFLLWRTKVLKQFFNVPMIFFVIGLGVMVFITKSTGAIALYILGLVALSGLSYFKTRWILIGLCLVPIIYVYQNASNTLDRQWVVEQMTHVFSEQRVGSYRYRVEMEDALVRWTHQRPIFGWARQYMRPGSYGDLETDIEGGGVTDSMWVIAFAGRGIVGLTADMALILLPAIILYRKIPPRFWTLPSVSSAVVLALILVLWMWDNLLNSMPNPIYYLAVGGLLGLPKVTFTRRVAFADQAPGDESRSTVPGQYVLPDQRAQRRNRRNRSTP